MITLREDPRVTPVGKYLRKSKVNELPQIINVLSGEMSWVGPRPLVESNFSAYEPHIQQKIGRVKPGITGIGSIVFRDEERLISTQSDDPHQFYRAQIAPYKGALESWYVDHRNLLVDFQILLLTAWVILFPNSELVYQLFPSLPPKPATFASD